MQVIDSNILFPVDIYGRTVKAIFLGAYYDHPQIIAINTITKDTVWKTTIPKITAPDSLYQYPCIELPDLAEGKYELYTTNADESERSYGTTIVVTEDKTIDILSRAAKLVGVDSNERIKDILQEINCTNLVQNLLKEYKNESDEDNKTVIGLLFLSYLDILNKRIQNQSFTAVPFMIQEESFQMDHHASRVLRYDINTKDIMKIDHEFLQDTYRAQEKIDHLYFYVEIGDNDLPINFQFSFKPSLAVSQYLKEQQKSRDTIYQRTIERVVDYPLEYLSFSEKELTYLSLIDKLQSAVPFLHAPTLSYEHGKINVTLFEDDVLFFDLASSYCYLAINEPEYCQDNSRRRIPMEPSNFTIYNEAMGLGAEIYLYWIEDPNGIILSNIKVLDLSSDESNVSVIFDREKNQDFNERLRKFDLYHYEKHLKPYLMANENNSYDMLKNALEYCIGDGISDSSNLARNILTYHCLPKNIYTFQPFAFTVMKDKITYGRYQLGFFKSPIYYKYKKDTVVLPMGEEILYKIECYNFTDGWKLSYIPAETDSTLEYRFQNTEYGFITAINLKTMRTSGVLMLDFSRHGLRADAYKYMISNVEVDY